MNGKCRIQSNAGWLVIATQAIFLCLLPLSVCKGIADIDAEIAEMASKPIQNSQIFPNQNANQQSNVNDAADEFIDGWLNVSNLRVRAAETTNYHTNDGVDDSRHQYMESDTANSPYSAHKRISRSNQPGEYPEDRIRFENESKSTMSQSNTGYNSPGQFNSRDIALATTRQRTQPPLIHHADRPTNWSPPHLPAIAASVTTPVPERGTQPPLIHHAERPAIWRPYPSSTTSASVPNMPTTNQPPRPTPPPYFHTGQSPWINRHHKNITTVQPTPTRSNTTKKLCPSEGGKSKLCVPVQSCKTFSDIVEKVSPVPPFYWKHLRSLRCDHRDNVYYMCCSEDQIKVSVTSRNDGSPEPKPTTSPQASNCGRVISEENRMVQGNNAFLGEFPWMALLQYDNATGKCSGSLISEQYVLTAARCSDKHTPKSVLLGEYHKSKAKDCDERNICMSPVQKIHIKWFRAHPKYNKPRFSNDIAVIRLRKPAILLDNVIPICLPITEELQHINVDHMTIAGWGLTKNKRASKILQKAIISLMSMSKCQSPNQHLNPASQICAGGQTRIDHCRGDTGAPLLVKSNDLSLPGVQSGQGYVQYGVLSYGMGKCGKGQENRNSPATFTRVVFYMKWILDQMNVPKRNQTRT